MGLFNDITRDARRTVRSSAQIVQRMADDAATSTPAAALPPAPPIEEQPDGALTVYRFQKEGQVTPREVPNRVETGVEQRRHVDPSVNGGRSSESKERVTQVIDNAFVLDDPSNIASSQKNGLVTGEGDTAHTERQNSTVSEASSIDLLRHQIISDDLRSVESPHGLYGPVDTFSGDSLQRETGERVLSRDAGLGTPSEPISVRWTAIDDEPPVPETREQMENEPAAESTNSTESHELSKEQQGKRLSGVAAVESSLPAAQQTERYVKQSSLSPSRRLETDDQFQISSQEKAREKIEHKHAESTVSIGQVDVIVVSNVTAAKVSAPSTSTSRDAASRRYWRRL